MLPRTIYMPAHPEGAVWLQSYYADRDGLMREEIIHLTRESDESEDFRRRISLDNGVTWAAFESMPDRTRQLPGGGCIDYTARPFFARRCGKRFDVVMRRLWPGNRYNTLDWQTGNHPFSDHVFVREDGGPEILLRYEDGPDYDPADPFDPAFHRANCAYAGQAFAEGQDGAVFFPVFVMVGPAGKRRCDGGVILMRRDPLTGRWAASNRADISPEFSKVGLEEPDVAVLRDGAIMVVCRALRAKPSPPRKWMTLSTDGGHSLAPLEPVRYDDGSPLSSQHSIHYFFRSTRNGRLYWILNIGEDTDDELGGPRYPLVIAEFDEVRRAVKKDSLVVVDDRRPGDTEALQLSNFALIENRATLDLEIYVTRIGENPSKFWSANVCRYIFSPPA